MQGFGIIDGDGDDPFHEMAFTPTNAVTSPGPPAASTVGGSSIETPPARKHRQESFFGLPSIVDVLYRQRGVGKLYEWQETVLTSKAVEARQNFVYSLPTSGGKTLVAEIISMRTVLNEGKHALFVLPYVAIAEEKLASTRRFAETLGFSAEGYYGTCGRFPVPTMPSLLVCTIEKAGSVVNHLFEEGRKDEVGSIVIDELHMIGDGKRGATLELLLTKVRSFTPHAQIVGMSATIPNLPELATWLAAECYVGTFRPVPLTQHVVCKGTVSVGGEVVRCLRSKSELDCMIDLVLECAPTSSVVVFCSTRSQCVDTAMRLKEALCSAHGPAPQGHAISRELKGLDHFESTLADVVSAGVAYHHGGLLSEERQIIERSFGSRSLSVVCCTSTLAAGVNLPARRVVIRSPYIGRDFLSKSMYQQMCGRAGRAGLDDRGESFLVVSAKDAERGERLASSPTEPISSKLLSFEGASLARSLLDVIAVGVCQSTQDAQKFYASTLHGQSLPDSARLDDVSRALRELCDSGFASAGADGALSATGFGRASVRSCFSFEEAIFIRSELQKVSDNGLVLSHDLHTCYLLTPVQDIVEPDWRTFQTLISRLSPIELTVLDRVGVCEHTVDARASGLQAGAPASKDGRLRLFVARRFYAALMLADLLNETPLHTVEQKFQVNRGQVQALMKSAAMFSSSICSFCASVEWFSLEAVLSAFVKRLGYGVRPDLVPLMDIKGVTPGRARALWNAGVKNAAAVVKFSPEELKEVVKKTNPDSRSVKYFTLRSASAVIREANRLLQSQIRDRQHELLELTGQSAPATQKKP